MDQTSAEFAAASQSKWLPNPPRGPMRKFLRNRKHSAVICLVDFGINAERRQRVLHDGALIVAALDTMRLAVGSEMVAFEPEGISLQFHRGFKDTVCPAPITMKVPDTNYNYQTSATCP